MGGHVSNVILSGCAQVHECASTTVSMHTRVCMCVCMFMGNPVSLYLYMCVPALVWALVILCSPVHYIRIHMRILVCVHCTHMCLCASVSEPACCVHT